MVTPTRAMIPMATAPPSLMKLPESVIRNSLKSPVERPGFLFLWPSSLRAKRCHQLRCRPGESQDP
jgi:hypothetical protein